MNSWLIPKWSKFLKEHREAAANHPIEPVGAELRNLMSWLK